MNQHFPLAAMALALGLATAAQAHESTDNEVIKNRIIHRLNDRGMGDQPTAGSTGQATPVITWHGGPVMSGAPNVHLIWYGNWNQSNGSDTPSGQQIIRDLVYEIGRAHV